MLLARNWRNRPFVSVSVLGIVWVLSGCTAVKPTDSNVLAVSDDSQAMRQAMAAASPIGPSISVEIRPSGRKAEIRQMALPGPVRIQEALEQMGLIKRFRRMDILLMRTASNERHKLEVKFDPSKHAVNPYYDYALHPGDHLVVIQSTKTVLDDMLQSVTGPLGQAIGR